MNKIINILIIFTFALSADISVNITPDTLYVGSLATISLTVENLNNEEIVLFNDLNEDSDHYSLIDKILTNNSAHYKIQCWKAGTIIIPPFNINIKRLNQNIIKMETEELNLIIHSNISNPHSSLRDIKSMKEIKLNSALTKFIYFICLSLGIIIIYFLWNKRVINNNSKYTLGNYYKDGLNEALESINTLPLPDKINSQSTEYYYLKLSKICRQFIKEHFYIKATEMTTSELSNYFKSIGIENKIVELWIDISKKVDMAKYAKHVPSINEYQEDKLNFCNIIRSFHKIASSSSYP
jgi:hypothetical protein